MQPATHTHSSVFLHNMDVALKLLLLAALTLLASAQTPIDYKDLSTTLQEHIDKALEEGNRKFGGRHHVALDSFVTPAVTRQSSLNVNVFLKVTTCMKTRSYKHRPECNTQKRSTPKINCLVCKMKNGTELVHCARKIDILHGEHKEIRDNCDVTRIGVSSLMAQTMPDDYRKQVGCLGCI